MSLPHEQVSEISWDGVIGEEFECVIPNQTVFNGLKTVLTPPPPTSFCHILTDIAPYFFKTYRHMRLGRA